MTRANPSKNNNWIATFNLTLFSAYFHATMEWLFFVTKPSNLSVLSFFEKVKVLVTSGGVLALILLAALIVLSIPAWSARTPGWRLRLSQLRLLPPAFMLSVTTLILLDNFTYTVFKFGIITTISAWRILYTLGFLLIFGWMFRFTKRIAPTLKASASYPSLGLLALSLTGILSIYLSLDPYLSSTTIRLLKPSAERPNVLILGADGLSAEFLSTYGYSIDTTPFLQELSKSSLVAENAFTNASSTTASTTSALTGKEPADVGVYRYPDILSDEDSFEHLPGILNHQGYKTAQIGTPNYVDAEEVNLLDGFDIANNEYLQQPALDVLRAVLGNSPSTYFVQTVAARALERVLHIFFVQDMENPFEEVNNPKVRMSDAERTDQIIELLETSRRPVFVFAHFMDTHGPIFSSEHGTGTTESGEDDKAWDLDLYREAITSFDDHVREIYTYLERSGKLDNTIIVIYTDHGLRYTVNQRVPIMIRFPQGEHSGTRRNNVQVIDIPVTLLDYLGIVIPDWMSGTSILTDEPPADRQLFSITAGSPRKIDPPFYQIKTMQLIVCQKWYALNVQENIWRSGNVKDHTTPCAEDSIITDGQAREIILEYLETHGYDIDSLQ